MMLPTKAKKGLEPVGFKESRWVCAQAWSFPKAGTKIMPMGERIMWIVKGAFPVVVSAAILAAVSAILFYFKLATAGSHHLVFFYLLPVVLVAILYNGRLAMLCAAAALVCADYYLQDPVYSFYVNGRLEYGDLVCFAVLASIAIKCTRELMRPAPKVPSARARYGRP
jgi:K+-sensing histidine kinase KdpD